MKSNQRIELTKRLLQEGLLRIMERKPLDKISVTELCSESGINRATFYRHYSIPRDVLLDMQKKLAEEVNQQFFQNEINDVKAYLEAFFSFMFERADIIRLFIQNCTDEDMLKMVSDTLTRVSTHNIPFVSDSVGNEADMKLILFFIIGGAYYALRQWLLEDTPEPPEKIARIFLSYLDYSSSIYSKTNQQSKNQLAVQ